MHLGTYNLMRGSYSIHAGVLPLPPALEIVSSWWVIGASGVLFLVEFFADKVPAFDLIWNALHTFVRIPVAALLAYGATSQLSPQKQMLATVVGGLIAFAAHAAHFLFDGTLAVVGIWVIRKELQRARATFGVKFLEEARHLYRIVASFCHQMRSHQIGLALCRARKFQQNTVGSQSDTHLRQLPDHRTARHLRTE